MREVVEVAAYRPQATRVFSLKMNLFSGTAKLENKTMTFLDGDEEGY